jgi:hypothetical protein
MTFRIASLLVDAYLQVRSETHFEREQCMFDLILLAMGLGFFVLSIGYAYACDRL